MHTLLCCSLALRNCNYLLFDVRLNFFFLLYFDVLHFSVLFQSSYHQHNHFLIEFELRFLHYFLISKMESTWFFLDYLQLANEQRKENRFILRFWLDTKKNNNNLLFAKEVTMTIFSFNETQKSIVFFSIHSTNCDKNTNFSLWFMPAQSRCSHLIKRQFSCKLTFHANFTNAFFFV